MDMEKELNDFLAYWNDLVDDDEVSSLSTLEITALRIYSKWLEKRNWEWLPTGASPRPQNPLREEEQNENNQTRRIT